MNSRPMFRFIASIACAASFLTALPARAQQSTSAIPDITGSWERSRDATLPAAGQPPLKPQYMKEWQAKQQAARDASAQASVAVTDPDGSGCIRAERRRDRE